MKKLFTVFISAVILTNAIFCADKAKDKESLVGIHGSKYTFVFDITNESDKRVSFYVVRDPKDNIIGAEPELWYEISVPPKSSDIYTYSVKKGIEDTCHFQWITEYHFTKMSGSAKIGYGDAKSKILIKEDLDTWVDKEGWLELFHMGKLSTFSAPDYKTYDKARNDYEKENCTWIAYKTRNLNTNEISNTGGYKIYGDEPREEVLKRHKDWMDEKGLVITDKYQAATEKEASKGIRNVRSYESHMLGQWEGKYLGLRAWFTLRSNHFYRLEIEDGAWEQYVWIADPEFINFTIFTTKEKIIARYAINSDGISFTGYGDWKEVTFYDVTEDFEKRQKAAPYRYRLKNAPRQSADYVNFFIGYKEGDKLITRFSSGCKDKIIQLLTDSEFSVKDEIIILNSNPQE